MLKNPSQKYKAFPPVSLPDRKWPNRTLTHAPRWCSVDLRDGNQALAVPMNVSQKLELFQTLVKVGFKEIEVGFPWRRIRGLRLIGGSLRRIARRMMCGCRCSYRRVRI